MQKDEIEIWGIEKIIPYVRNPAKHPDEDVVKMAGLLKEFGCRPPLLIKSDGELVDGHLRYLASLRLGWDKVPTISCDDWTDAKIKAYRITSRTSANWAEWDDELLKLEVADLKEMDFDIDNLGFSDEDFSGFDEPAGTPSLDDLEKEYGEPKDDDFYPIIKVQATPDGKKRFEQLMEQSSGNNEYEKFDVLLEAIDADRVL
jgi:ParB-like chromosome segregation protein Spo0J